MRVLFDLGHPAHFHLFRHAIAELKQDGHDVVLFARRKDCLPDLLDGAGLSYQIVSRPAGGLVGLGAEALHVLCRVVALAAERPFDLMVGTSIVAPAAARLTGATSVVFNEDDAAVVPLFARLAYGPAHYVVTPRCLAFERHGLKHLTYPGYHELAYLRPGRFQPDPAIREALGVAPHERYFLVRLVALRAHHDVGQRGLSGDQARQVVRRLADHGHVFVSHEDEAADDVGARPLPVAPGRIFDVLAFADMVIGDSQTVAAEAAVLGTPSIRCNTFVGRLTYLEELEHKYGLTVGIDPADFDRLLAQIDDWLARPNLRDQWQRRRQAMLAETVDVTEWMLGMLRCLGSRKPMPETPPAPRADRPAWKLEANRGWTHGRADPAQHRPTGRPGHITWRP